MAVVGCIANISYCLFFRVINGLIMVVVTLGPQIAAPYSMCGLIRELYIIATFPLMWAIWYLKESCSSNLIPTYLNSCIYSISVLSM